jgi:serine/threonine-protein kinase
MSYILCGQCGQKNSVTASQCSHCDTNLLKAIENPFDPYFPGTYLQDGRYLIQAVLASGTSGVVYQATDTQKEDISAATISAADSREKNQAIALREVTPPISHPEILANIVAKIVQYLNAAISAQNQFYHPQIAQFWQLFTEDNRIFLVGDLLEGKSAKFLLKQRQYYGETCFREAEIIQLWQNILPVLAELHDRGMVHGYITPENIIYSGRDRPVILADCGGIQELALQLTSTTNIQAIIEGYWGNIPKGKPGYAPEEQLRSGIIAPHSDLYALAVTSIVLMTGKPPHKLINLFTMSWNWQRELNLTPVIKDCLTKMLASEPTERFQTANELLEILASNSDILLPILQSEASIPDDFDLGDRGSNTIIKTPEYYPKILIAEAAEKSAASPQQVSSDNISTLDQINGWNWAAALLPGIWCLSNGAGLGLLAWVGFLLDFPTGIFTWIIAGIILGLNGNKISWESGKWESLEAFKNHQKGWINFLALLLLILTPIVIMMALLGL